MSGFKKKNILELTRVSAEQYIHRQKMQVKLMADNVRSMHNVGSLFRTADAFLIDEIILCGISGVPPHPDIEKTALGADRSVAWRYVEDALSEAQRLQAEGWKICVVEQTHESISLQQFLPSGDEKYLLIVGNEVSGVDQRIADIAGIALEIPQAGTKHSLNVAVCGGIVMWHFFSHLVRKEEIK